VLGTDDDAPPATAGQQDGGRLGGERLEAGRQDGGRPEGGHFEGGRQDGGRRTHRSPDDAPGLREYLSLLRRYWLLALLTFVVVLAASVGSLLVTDPVYRSEAEVLLRTEDSRQLFPRVGGTPAGSLVRSPEAEVLYVRSDEFQESLEEAIEGDASVDVRSELGSSALVFTAEAGEPELAQQAAQTAAETYVAVRQELDLSETADLAELLAGDRGRLQEQLQTLLEPVAELDEAINATEDPTELSPLLNQRLALERSLEAEVDPLQSELRRLDAQIATLDLERRVLEDPESLARVITAAERPEGRADGSITQSLAVGVLGGLVLAAGAVAAAQALRRR